MKRLISRLILVFAGIFIGLFILELSLRLIGFTYILLTGKKSNQISEQNNKFTILCVGESSTYGLGAENDSYPVHLEKILNEKAGCKGCYSTSILAWPGASTSKLLLDFPQKLKGTQPKIVIIMTGANYAFNFIGNPVLYTKERNARFGYILEKIYDLKITKILLWATILKDDNFLEITKADITPTPQGERKEFIDKNMELIREQLTEDLNKFILLSRSSGAIPVLMYYPSGGRLPFAKNVYQEVANDNKVLLIDQQLYFEYLINSGLKKSDLFMSDFWHPNNIGYEYMAKYISKQLEDNKILP